LTIRRHGIKAIDLVMTILSFLLILKLQYPFITYCPVKEPVLVELIPDANKPIAYKTWNVLPRLSLISSPAAVKLKLSPETLSVFYGANEPITAILIINDTKSIMNVSSLKYPTAFLASL